MTRQFFRAAPLLACLLAACSAQLLEEVSEIPVPRPCSETTKLFGTFSMRAKSATWKGDKGDHAATLTLDLAFTNDKGWPISLSNSGNGVIYTVGFKLVGDKAGTIVPKDANGVTLVPKPKEFKERPSPGPFGYPQRSGRSKSSGAKSADRGSGDGTGKTKEKPKDVNYRIPPGNTEQGKLVFSAPPDNYLLSIERQFDGKPSGQPTDHIGICKITAS